MFLSFVVYVKIKSIDISEVEKVVGVRVIVIYFNIL